MPENDLEGALGATSGLALPIEFPPGAVKRLIDSLLPLIIGDLNDLPDGPGATNRPPPRTGPLNVLSDAPGSTDLPSAPRAMPPSRTVPDCIRSTLFKYKAWALLLASDDLNPSVPSALFEEATGLPVLGPVRLIPFLRSVRFLTVLPLSVRSVVTGLIPPVFVLTTGSTTATLLPSWLITLLLTMAFLFTNGGRDTTTVVVKL